MKISFKVFAMGLFSTSMMASASELSTKWTIKNNSKESLALTCKNISEKDSNIAMTSRSIKPSKSEVFDWGDNYYNDGLWLNAGNWNCTTKNTTKLPSDFENFSTEWGESVSLIVNAVDGKLKLTKVEKKDASLAVKKENNKENSVE
ncbi:MAG: hypothetical protein K2X69_08260 [Silvanigrellaceae bacterium]|nr:hypothetical protein [Silvanigrellaceae bacterium]